LIRRSIPEEWSSNPPTLLTSLANDPELCLEIRDNSVTIYYRGKAVIRELGVRSNQVVGSIHHRYIPLSTPDSKYVDLSLSDSGFSFASPVEPLSLEMLQPETIAKVKAAVKSANPGKENRVIQGLVTKPDNQIVDQEVAFQSPGERSFDKIDLCLYDRSINAFSLAEVKEVGDPRLFDGDDGVPEVIKQLDRYRQRIEANASSLVGTFNHVVCLKRKLGWGNRLSQTPLSDINKIVTRPMLVIGGCTRPDVTEIWAGTGRWEILMKELPKVASGLLVCGSNGGVVELKAGPQRKIFDTSTCP
jgi:hypothetical protein